MTITYDALDDLKAKLIAQWNATGAGGTQPTINIIWDKKEVGLDANQEEVLLTPVLETVKPFDLYGRAYWHEIPIKIDIRSWTTIARHEIIVKEVERIIQNIIRRNADGFIDLIYMDSESYNPDYRNMFRHVITLKYRSAVNHTFV